MFETWVFRSESLGKPMTPAIELTLHLIQRKVASTSNPNNQHVSVSSNTLITARDIAWRNLYCV